jgi:hypothetical protein
MAGEANAQKTKSAKEVTADLVYILGDSLGWLQTRRVDPVMGLVTCTVETRNQPGAIAAKFHDGTLQFSVSLMDSSNSLYRSRSLDSVLLHIDDLPTLVRRPTAAEAWNSLLLMKNDAVGVLRGAKRLRIRGVYREGGAGGAGGHVALDIDLRGLTALWPGLNTRGCQLP